MRHGHIAVAAITMLIAMPAAAANAQEADTLARSPDRIEAADSMRASTSMEAALRPGDVIRLASWSDESLDGDYTVAPTGSVTLPLLGRMDVTDTPADVVWNRLEDQYEARFREPAVEVQILRRIRVLGSVRSPGIYMVDRTASLSDAIAMAGGTTDIADWEEIEIHREGRREIVSLDEGTPQRVPIHSADQIVVPERSWLSRNSTMVIGATISAVALFISRSASN